MIETLDLLTRNTGLCYYLIPVASAQQVKELTLTKKETAKYVTLKLKKKRDEWLSGRYAAKKALYRFNGANNSEVLNRDGGQPYFYNYPKLSLSISHSNNYAVAIVSEKKIGIDIELIEPRPGSLTKFFFNKREQEFISQQKDIDKDRIITEFWTRKEAVSKLLGKGGAIAFNQIEVIQDKIRIPNYLKTRIVLATNSIKDYSVSIAMEEIDG